MPEMKKSVVNMATETKIKTCSANNHQSLFCININTLSEAWQNGDHLGIEDLNLVTLMHFDVLIPNRIKSSGTFLKLNSLSPGRCSNFKSVITERMWQIKLMTTCI